MVGSRIDLGNCVFSCRQGRVADIELKWNVGNQLRVTTGLRLGRHGHRTNQNDYRDYCVSLLFHLCFSCFFRAAVEATGGLD